MLNIQKKYINYLDELANVLAENQIEIESLEPLRQALPVTELLIPIIGGFSAGKSSLLNAWLDRDVLPVGITPETELATELRYDQNERIEAVGHDDEVTQFTLDQMEQIKGRSSEFSHLRVYIANERLKAIAPLVLVDMPGFDSALANHNKAIIYYINRGAHYIVLTGVEDGNLTRSIQRQLADIQTFGRDFSFMLSKANLRAQSEVVEVVNVIGDQLEMFLGARKTVIAVGLNGREQLDAVLAKIDPEQIYHKLFIDSLKQQHIGLIENLNVRLVALSNSAQDNEHAISTMRAGLEHVLLKRDQLLREAKNRFADAGVNSCIDAVGRELNNSVEELVTASMSGNKDAFSRSIAEIVRSTLLQNIKTQVAEVNDRLIAEFSLELKEINLVMSNFTDNKDWLADFTDKTKLVFEKTETFLSTVGDHLAAAGKAKNIFKALSTILAVTTSVVTPILELVIIFLPDLLSGFFANRQKETVRNAIISDVIPSIKAELRGKLPALFEEQLSDMIKQISMQFEQAITEKQAVITQFEQERERNLAGINEEKNRLKQTQEKIQQLGKNALYDLKAA